MGHNASRKIHGKQEKAAKNDDAVSPEKFKRLESSICVIYESKLNHPINAVAQKQVSSLEKSDLNSFHDSNG
ncbi:hypothetical protein CHS0354_035477 [Potamilus streckersoni]|uniref:Uncharacterized protein n=1 Tax=Potamilus streckersoni TaxID=2493646 RepID=A0AAE0RW78_9BIVA|nr:hypothetical protein CHS0354_035477 [Potamilus streckersoni]